MRQRAWQISSQSRPRRGAKHFLRLVSLSRGRKTDALEKHTPNQRLSICVPASPQELVFFGSACVVFKLHFGVRGSSKSQHGSSIAIVTHVFRRWRLGIHMQISHKGHGKVSLTPHLHVATFIQPISVIGLLFWNDLLSLWSRIHQALDCSTTNRERELGLDRRETG